MLDALPTPDTDPELGNALMKRLWIARVDTDEPVQKAADRYVHLQNTLVLELGSDSTFQ